MRRQIISIIALVITSMAVAQNGFNYKALITDNGNVLNTQSVTFKFTVLENGSTAVYQETQTATTDANGIVAVNVGEGTVVSGNFSTIDWGSNPYFLKVEINTGGSGYHDFGTTEFKYVPYAKFSEKAGGIANGAIKLDDLSDARSDTNGSSVFIGTGAGENDDLSDNRNAGIGYMALNNNTTGVGNAASGRKALFMNVSGSYNTADGYVALRNNSTGNSNVAVGIGALYENTDRSNLVAVGDSALYNNGNGASGTNEAIHNTALGSKALYANTAGRNNTATGFKTLFSNTTGYDNTANGYLALTSNTVGVENTATGYRALGYNTSGEHNTANGYLALYNNTTGSNNTANGHWALYHNTTGSYNTALGHKAFYNGSNYHNSTALGYSASISASNQIRLGNSSVSSIGGYANWTNLSDGRFKKDVKENVVGLAFINKLRPVTYHLDMDAIAKFLKTSDNLRIAEAEQLKAAELQTGFIAQEVEQVAKSVGYDFHGVDTPDNENDHYGLRYAEFVVPLVKAVQELNQKHDEEVKTLKTTIQNQQKKIEEQEKRIQRLEELLLKNK